MKEAIIQYNEEPGDCGTPMVISWKELVRCQDCKHCDTDTLEHCWCMILARSREPDWFCGDGERRTE